MLIKNFLTEKSFKVGVDATEKEDIIKEISEFFAKQHGLNEKEVATALWEREQKGSTGLGKGLAVPHARMKNLDVMKVCVFLSKEGRDFNAYDHLPTNLFFVAVIQENSHPQDQLDMLRLLVETTEKTDLMKSLEQVSSERDLRDLLLRRLTEAETFAE